MIKNIQVIGIFAMLISLGMIRVFAEDTETLIKMMESLEKRINSVEYKLASQNKHNQNSEKKEGNAVGLSPDLESLKKDVGQIKNNIEKMEKLNSSDLEELSKKNEALIQTIESLEKKLESTKSEEKEVAWTPEMKSFLVYDLDVSKDSEYSNSLSLDRAYIGAKYNVSDDFQFHFLSDVGRESGSGVYQLYAKYAYLKWKSSTLKSTVKIGLQGTTNWKPAEKVWGYRIVKHAPLESFGKAFSSSQKSFKSEMDAQIESLADSANVNMDLEEAARLEEFYGELSQATKSKTGSSADLGLTIEKKWQNNMYGILSVINGSGYKSAENDKFKNVQLRLGGYFLDKKLHLTGMGEWEPWSVDSDSEMRSNLLFDALLEYIHNKHTSLSVNAAFKKFDVTPELLSGVYSVFGKTKLNSPKFMAFARYDIYQSGFNDLSKELNLDNDEFDGGLLVLGIDYTPIKNVSVIPNFQSSFSSKSGSEPHNKLFIHIQAKF